jgi:hypothetical protein
VNESVEGERDRSSGEEGGAGKGAATRTEELDLTGEATGEGPPPPPEERPWNPEPRREQMRGLLASALVLLLALTIGAAFSLEAAGLLSRTQIDALLRPIFPSLVALTGTALGFYFGGRGPSS